MELSMQEKLKLIEFFEFQRDNEASKPLGEMNPEAVDAYVKVLLRLQDKHIELGSEFINEQVRKIFHPEDIKHTAPETVKATKKHINKKMVWLIAACIALLVALFSIVSTATEWDFVDFLTEKFGSAHSTPIGEKVDFDGETLILGGKSRTYESVEEALEAEKVEILYPSKLPKGIKIDRIMFNQNHKSKEMTCIFNDQMIFANICFNTSVSDAKKEVSTETRDINSVTCYICEMEDISTVQITFEYKNNTYTFSHTDKETIIEIIENLEEISYENQ